MKGRLKLILMVIGGVIVILAIQAGVVLGVGKERLSTLPLLGDKLFVIKAEGEIVEVDDQRFQKVDSIIADLKSKVAEADTLLQASKDNNDHLKQEIDKQKKKIDTLNTQLTQMLRIIDTSREKAIKATAQIYESMSPEAVAEVFKEMKDDEEIAELLMFMRDREAGKIMVAYIDSSQNDDERKQNAARVANITKIRQRLVKKSDLEI